MKNLDLLNVSDLTADEVSMIDGGSVWQDVKDFFSGIVDGFEHPSKS